MIGVWQSQNTEQWTTQDRCQNLDPEIRRTPVLILAVTWLFVFSAVLAALWVWF